ncbi:MAG: TerB family tellurite resistance protein [Sulfurovum sp.]|nr:TerB family tellurite resistance protein [Sulfurovum sp.]
MFKSLKRSVLKMFREFLVYHHSSLEFRAKLLTLMVSSDGEMNECEKQKLKEIAHEIYGEDQERAELLIDTVKEYHNKIVTDNGLDFEHLVQQVNKEVQEVKRFCEKIDIGLLMKLHECIDDEAEEERLFQMRIIEFLQGLKEACKV